MAEKCTIRDARFVDPCTMLASATEYGNPRGKQKGIFGWALHVAGKGASRTFYGAKSGEHVAKGLAFNYCPFCGESIEAPFTESSNG